MKTQHYVLRQMVHSLCCFAQLLSHLLDRINFFSGNLNIKQFLSKDLRIEREDDLVVRNGFQSFQLKIKKYIKKKRIEKDPKLILQLWNCPKVS